MNRIQTTCRCGSVRLTITGEPVAQIYCHCDDCQAAHAAAYVAASIYPSAAVQFEGGALTQVVIRRTPRMHCAACHTYLFAQIASPSLRSVNAWLLPPGAFKPKMHVQCQHALLPVQDDLPHYKAFPPAFGGSDACIAW